MHRLGPGGLDLEHGAREALRPHFLPFDLTDGAGGRGVNPSEAGPAPRQSGGGGGHAGLSKARDTRRRRGSGHRREPTGGGLWPGTAAGHLPCARRFPGAADATEGGRRPRLGGRRERLGRLRLSPGPPLPLPRLAATGGTESRPGCGVGRRGRRFTHLSFAPAAASCVSPGRRPGRGAEFASWGPGAVRERLGAPGCVDIGALSPPRELLAGVGRALARAGTGRGRGCPPGSQRHTKAAGTEDMQVVATGCRGGLGTSPG